MSKKTLYLLTIIGSLYYFFTRTEKGKEYSGIIRNKMKKIYPYFMTMPQIMKEKLQTLKKDMNHKKVSSR